MNENIKFISRFLAEGDEIDMMAVRDAMTAAERELSMAGKRHGETMEEWSALLVAEYWRQARLAQGATE